MRNAMSMRYQQPMYLGVFRQIPRFQSAKALFLLALRLEYASQMYVPLSNSGEIHDPVDPIHAEVGDYVHPIATVVAGGERRALAPVVHVPRVGAKATDPVGRSPPLVLSFEVAQAAVDEVPPASREAFVARLAKFSGPTGSGSGSDRFLSRPHGDLAGTVRRSPP
jgi:hypothetical protein